MAGTMASHKSGWNAFLWLVVVSMLGITLAGQLYFPPWSPMIKSVARASAALGAILVAFQTSHGAQAIQYWREALVETRKVVWPTQQETMQTTLAVLVMLFIMGVLLWTLDALLLKLVGFLTIGAGT